MIPSIRISSVLSVVIPCYNYGNYIEDTLQSVLNQTMQDFEVIIVDGGSTDTDTIKVLEQIGHPKVSIYFREGRHLVGDNRNYGIDRANGIYIVCLDADDILKPTYLEKAHFFAEAYGYDIVYPWVQCFGGSTELWAPEKTNILTCMMGATIPTTAMFKRSMWESVGGYRDWGLGGEHVPEDWDFWVRMLGHGCRVCALREPLMLYRVHEKGLTATNKMSFAKQRKKVFRANRKLFSLWNISSVMYRSVTRPNRPHRRDEKDDGKSDTNNVLLALPFMVTGGADTVLLQILKYMGNNDFKFS